MKTNEQIRHALTHALTAYDEKESRKKHWNPYALPQYLARVDDIMADIEAGADPAAAICAGFSGRLQSLCLKAAGGLTPVETRGAGWAHTPQARKA